MFGSMRVFLTILVLTCAFFNANAFISNGGNIFDFLLSGNNFGFGGGSTGTGNTISATEKDTFSFNTAYAIGNGSIANAGELTIKEGSAPPGGSTFVINSIDGGNNKAWCRPVGNCLANDGALVIFEENLPGRN